jgi:hypothetical protein
MKAKLCLALLKVALLMAPLSLYLGGTAIARAGDSHVSFARSVSAETSDYRAELQQGSLMVYSAADEFNDGGVVYYAHSSYAIYTRNGKFVKSVENQISRRDEIPEIVTLSAGSYIVEAHRRKPDTFRSMSSSRQVAERP